MRRECPKEVDSESVVQPYTIEASSFREEYTHTMKRKFLALAAVMVAGAAVVFGGTANAAGPGPQDHEWSVALSQYAPGVATDYTINLALGTNGVPSNTGFFSEATAMISGFDFTQCLAKNTAGVLGGTCAIGVGAHVGNTSFSIGTNNHVGWAGNIDPVNGQAPKCGDPGTTAVGPLLFDVFAGVADTGSATVATTPNGMPGYVFADEPDIAHGGIPLGASKAPDWYAPVISGIGAANAVLMGRGFGLAPLPGGGVTEVTFLTIKVPNTTPQAYASVTILNNPVATFDPLHQTAETCPPFSSTVTALGTAMAETWNCATNPMSATGWYSDMNTAGKFAGCGTPLSSTGGVEQKIAAAATGTNSFKILLSSAADVDGDGVFGQWDPCQTTAGTTADALNNGIGDDCRPGSGPATVTCGGVGITLVPPFAPCQDADGDGALNQGDNCQFVANVGGSDNQNDTDRDGIGNACETSVTAANVAGSGTGYAVGFLVGGGASGIATAGTYKDYNDICDHRFLVGTGMVGAAGVCLANNLGLNVIDSSQSNSPDFLNPGSGQCVHDFKSDSNHDGYSDGIQGAPAATPAGCTYTVLLPAPPAARMAPSDPLLVCPGRLALANGGNATTEAAYRIARADVNATNNKVTLADLIVMAGKYGNNVDGTGMDYRSVLDLSGNSKVDLADLIIAAGKYGQVVPAC